MAIESYEDHTLPNKQANHKITVGLNGFFYSKLPITTKIKPITWFFAGYLGVRFMKNTITIIEKISSLFPMLLIVGFNVLSYQNIPSYLEVLSGETDNFIKMIVAVFSTHKYWFVFSVMSVIGVVEIIFREKRYGWILIIISLFFWFLLLPIVSYISFALT